MPSPVIQIRGRHPIQVWAKANNIKLEAWLCETGFTRAALSHWHRRRFLPNSRSLMKIHDGTNGAVTAQDCLNYYRNGLTET